MLVQARYTPSSLTLSPSPSLCLTSPHPFPCIALRRLPRGARADSCLHRSSTRDLQAPLQNLQRLQLAAAAARRRRPQPLAACRSPHCHYATRQHREARARCRHVLACCQPEREEEERHAVIRHSYYPGLLPQHPPRRDVRRVRRGGGGRLLHKDTPSLARERRHRARRWRRPG